MGCVSLFARYGVGSAQRGTAWMCKVEFTTMATRTSHKHFGAKVHPELIHSNCPSNKFEAKLLNWTPGFDQILQPVGFLPWYYNAMSLRWLENADMETALLPSTSVYDTYTTLNMAYATSFGVLNLQSKSEVWYFPNVKLNRIKISPNCRVSK